MSRFVLVFVLARYLPPEAVGTYGLVAGSVAFAIYVLGFDLHTFTTREIIAGGESETRWKVILHFRALAGVMLLALPLIVLPAVFGIMAWSVVGWVLIVAVGEHWGQEVDRLLVAMSDQLSASIVILMRQGAMPVIAIFFLIAFPTTRFIEFVFILWAFFNFVGVAVGIALLRSHLTRSGQSNNSSVRWILGGFKVAFPYFLGTLCLKFMFTADRQIVASFSGLEVLAPYTLAITVASGISSLLAVGVHQFKYQLLVRAVQTRDLQIFARGMGSLWRQTAAIVAVAGFVAVTAFPVIPNFFVDPVYLQYDWAVPLAVVVFGIYNFSLVPHYALYALREDKTILWSTLVNVLCFVVATFCMIHFGANPVLAVLLGLGLASGGLLLAKSTAYKFAFAKRDWDQGKNR